MPSIVSILRRLIREAVHRVPGGAVTAQQALLQCRPFSADTVLNATCSGLFPMPGTGNDIEWHCPPQRAVVPIDGFHIRKSLRRIVRSRRFEIRLNTAVDEVIAACADRDDSWITPDIAAIYSDLFRRGFVKSVEAWQDDELVGGVYGLCLGRYFVSESQFHRVSNAGQVCFATLLEILRANGFVLHDVQHRTPFLEQFGAVEIDRNEFQSRVTGAILQPAQFHLPSSLLDRVVTDVAREEQEEVLSLETAIAVQ